jgi:hypothetical protein
MKKGSIIAGSTVLMALGGYGAWCAYKKMNPQGAKTIEKDVKKMTKNMEKSLEDMM